MSYDGPFPHSVPIGGTGATTLTGILVGNGTSPVTTTSVTNHAVLIGGASNAITNVTDVAVGSVLVSGGTSADPSFAANTTVGAWVKIAKNTPSGVATSTFAVSATYNNYILLVTDLVSSSIGNMQIQIDTGGGAITSGYFGGTNDSNYNGATLTNTNITSGFMFSPYAATTDFVSSTVQICNLTSGVDFITSFGQYTQFNSSGPGMKFGISCGSYNTSAKVAVNIIVSCTAGNITGTLTLYGLAES